MKKTIGISDLIIGKTDGNMLMAKFLEWEATSKYYYKVPRELWIVDEDGDITNLVTSTMCQFHNNWNWLMAVVEKIETLNCSVNINYRYCYLETESQGFKIETTGESKIEAVWKACSAFIQWYNQNEQK